MSLLYLFVVSSCLRPGQAWRWRALAGQVGCSLAIGMQHSPTGLMAEYQGAGWFVSGRPREIDRPCGKPVGDGVRARPVAPRPRTAWQHHTAAGVSTPAAVWFPCVGWGISPDLVDVVVWLFGERTGYANGQRIEVDVRCRGLGWNRVRKGLDRRRSPCRGNRRASRGRRTGRSASPSSLRSCCAGRSRPAQAREPAGRPVGASVSLVMNV